MPAGRRVQAYHRGIETLTGGKRQQGGAVGKLSRHPARALSYSSRRDTVPPPCCLIYPHTGSAAVYNSLLAQNPNHSSEMNLYEVTQGVAGVCWCVTVCHFLLLLFFSLIHYFLACDNYSCLNFVMNSLKMICHLFGCKLLYLEESHWSFDNSDSIVIFI